MLFGRYTTINRGLFQRVMSPLSTQTGYQLSRAFSASSTAEFVPALKGRNLTCIADLSKKELLDLVDASIALKTKYKHDKSIDQPFQGVSMAMIFQKRSTRTRISTETGIAKMGGHAIFLGSDDIQLGVNETLKDTAHVLSGFNDLILARVSDSAVITELCQESSVPVINALCDKYHPLQTLADLMTLKEHFGRLEGLTVSWVGDGNNVLHDLAMGAAKCGMNMRIATPPGYQPDEGVMDLVRHVAAEGGTSVVMTSDPKVAVAGANVIVTDTWVSMGQEEETAGRLKAFGGYQVTRALAAHTEQEDWVFLHCLPRHQEEVHDEVFYDKARSLVFQEAENRMWTVMAVSRSLLGL